MTRSSLQNSSFGDENSAAAGSCIFPQCAAEHPLWCRARGIHAPHRHVNHCGSANLAPETFPHAPLYLRIWSLCVHVKTHWQAPAVWWACNPVSDHRIRPAWNRSGADGFRAPLAAPLWQLWSVNHGQSAAVWSFLLIALIPQIAALQVPCEWTGGSARVSANRALPTTPCAAMPSLFGTCTTVWLHLAEVSRTMCHQSLCVHRCMYVCLCQEKKHEWMEESFHNNITYQTHQFWWFWRRPSLVRYR